MNARMKGNEYIEKAKALVEAKKQYYATLSELSKLTPDEEEKWAGFQQMCCLIQLLIEYRDKGEKLPLSVIGRTLGDTEPAAKEIYFSPEEAYKTFVEDSGLGEKEYEDVLDSFEEISSLLYLQPLRRAMIYINERRNGIRYDINEDEMRAMVSLVNDEDAAIIEECLVEYLLSKASVWEDENTPFVEDMANRIVELQVLYNKDVSLTEIMKVEQGILKKIAEWIELAYNYLLEDVRLTKKEIEILQPLLENPILVKYSKAGIYNMNSLILPGYMFDNYAPNYSVMFGNSLESKFQNPSSLSDFINYLGRNNYIDDDLTVKENLAYHITGVNRPTKVLETIVWHGETQNLFWLCKQMFGKYARMKTVFVAPDDPDFKKRSGEYAERPTKEFKKMFNSLFK